MGTVQKVVRNEDPGEFDLCPKSVEVNARRHAQRLGLRLSRIGVLTPDSPLAGTFLIYRDNDPIGHGQSLEDVEEWLNSYEERYAG